MSFQFLNFIMWLFKTQKNFCWEESRFQSSLKKFFVYIYNILFLPKFFYFLPDVNTPVPYVAQFMFIVSKRNFYSGSNDYSNPVWKSFCLCFLFKNFVYVFRPWININKHVNFELKPLSEILYLIQNQPVTWPTTRGNNLA